MRALSEQVTELSEINGTLKTYRERLVTRVDPGSAAVIEDEARRLAHSRAARNPGVRLISRLSEAPRATVLRTIEKAADTADLIDRVQALVRAHKGMEQVPTVVRDLLAKSDQFLGDMNEVRAAFERPALARPSPSVELAPGTEGYAEPPRHWPSNVAGDN